VRVVREATVETHEGLDPWMLYQVVLDFRAFARQKLPPWPPVPETEQVHVARIPGGYRIRYEVELES
jgi:hypothetical protein